MKLKDGLLMQSESSASNSGHVWRTSRKLHRYGRAKVVDELKEMMIDVNDLQSESKSSASGYGVWSHKFHRHMCMDERLLSE